MKLTRKMEDLFKKWKTTIRPDRQSVTHPTYKTTRLVDPVAFAVYETALKANYAHQFAGMALNNYRTDQLMGVMAHFQDMADPNDIGLPLIDDKDITQDYINQTAQDYDYCAAWLSRAGLYYDLLD